jgi:hypothetical protein
MPNSLLEDVLLLVTLVAVAFTLKWCPAACPFSVRPPVYVSSARRGRISVKFDIGEFHESLSRNSKFG